jgi:thiosulfate dehydrogenase [quinone] large subunit
MMSARGPLVPAFARSWQEQSWPLRILRAFLGATFTYAGLQKLADPGFLHAGTPDFIGAQLKAFAQGSPIRPLILLAGHVPVLAGVAVGLVEIAVGIATLAGVAPVATASTGLALNLILFLSASWHVHPYFLGSDSIYAVAWIALLAGVLQQRHRNGAHAAALRSHGTRRQRTLASEPMGRREVIRSLAVGLVALVAGGLAFAFEGKESVAADPPRPIASASEGPGPTPSGSTGTITGTPIASLDRIPIGGAMNFNDPALGPATLVRLSKERVAAFSRTCTHAGCLVDYDTASKLLVCPCHGAEFDPSRGAEVVAGPAPSPLERIPVAVEASGTIVASS